METTNKNQCPLHAVDQRLRDGLDLAIELKNVYFVPERFRLFLNSSLQTLRSITFILQKQKANYNNFDKWYGAWQEKMKNDPKMKWLIDSRNIVEKEGDLVTLSRARVSIVESWQEHPSIEIDVPPFSTSREWGEIISSAFPKTKWDVGLLRIERRWVDSRMPDYELLEILVHALKILFCLLKDAHDCLLDGSERDRCSLFGDISEYGEFPTFCELGSEWDRTMWIDLRRGRVVEPKSEEKMPTKDELCYAAEHYKIDELKNQFESDGIDFEHEVNAWCEMAKQVLKTDGYHLPIAILKIPDNKAKVVGLKMNDRQEKHFMIRWLANEVETSKATSVILINEAWVANNQDIPPSGYACDASGREEALTVIGLNNDKEIYSHAVMFSRDMEGMIKFLKEEKASTGLINLIKPLLAVWDNKKISDA